jgi:Ca2+-binding RTX toxin-like protein
VIFDTNANPTYTIKVEVQDAGGLTYEEEFTINVTPTYPPGFIGVVADPANPGQQMLLVIGTNADDVITVTARRVRISRGNFTTVYFVTLNRVQSGPYSPTSHIVVQSLAGNDSIRFRGNFQHAATIDGGDDNDSISASNLDDIIYGGDGDDTIFGYGGADTVYGGKGNDKIFGFLGKNIMFGEQGNDQITGQGVLVGGEGNDGLNSIGSRNLMIGGIGSDTFIPGDIKPDTIGDIIINGTAAFENDVPKLQAIQNEWQTGNGASPASLDLKAILNDTDVDTLVNLTKYDYVLQGVNDIQKRKGKRKI